MRELTKSMISYTWATSLFGVQQLMNIVNPMGGDQRSPAAQAFDQVSQATTSQLNPTMKAAFDSAEGFQRSMVNMIFEAMDPSRWASMGNRMMDQTAMGARRAAQAGADAMRQGASAAGSAAAGAMPQAGTGGFGPMPR
jgi:hypothetical protein